MVKEELIAQLLEIAQQENPDLGLKNSRVPNFLISRRVEHKIFEHTVYQPCVVFVLKGSKQVNFAGNFLSYGSGEFLVMTTHMPGSFCVGTQDFVAITMLLDHCLLTQVCQELGNIHKDGSLPAMGTAEFSDDILECLVRIMQCPKDEVKLKYILPYYLKELYIYLLYSPAGVLLWQIGVNDSPNHQLLKVIAYIREHFSEILRMEDLAKLANMSLPTFFRRFRQLTLNSPLQYQKAFQLQQARYLMLQKYLSLSQVAGEVGYASQQQFTREYKRYFGVTPSQDLQRVQSEVKDKGAGSRLDFVQSPLPDLLLSKKATSFAKLNL